MARSQKTLDLFLLVPQTLSDMPTSNVVINVICCIIFITFAFLIVGRFIVQLYVMDMCPPVLNYHPVLNCHPVMQKNDTNEPELPDQLPDQLPG